MRSSKWMTLARTAESGLAATDARTGPLADGGRATSTTAKATVPVTRFMRVLLCSNGGYAVGRLLLSPCGLRASIDTRQAPTHVLDPQTGRSRRCGYIPAS